MPKVSPIDGVFRPTNILKIIIPNKNQILPLNILLYMYMGGGGGGGGGYMSLFENIPRKWPNSHSQKLFLSLFEKWQNSILLRCSAISSFSKYTTHYIFKC